MTYYIDNKNGKADASGISPEDPLCCYKSIELKDGDTVLFCRGNLYREKLLTVPNVKYAAYGEGEQPTFCVSTDISSDWEETETENVWLCKTPIRGEVGNLIFNKNECTATLRWERGDLCRQGDFWDSRYGMASKPAEQTLLLYSTGDPAKVYSHIEAASYADRHCADIKNGNTFDGLCFMNSGVHALAGSADNVTVQNCTFRNIGGCVWSAELRIRFGNAVEFWRRGNNILIELCLFFDIYDSCVTHQGPGERTEPTENFICRYNIFRTYGMAAFEYRDKMPIASSFHNNICSHAGEGFAMLGEGTPRRSEIYPEPMGHHIFLWRMDQPTAGGSLDIRDNTFDSSPAGAAVYSRISPSAEAQITLQNNSYCEECLFAVKFGGKIYEDGNSFEKNR